MNTSRGNSTIDAAPTGAGPAVSISLVTYRPKQEELHQTLQSLAVTVQVLFRSEAARSFLCLVDNSDVSPLWLTEELDDFAQKTESVGCRVMCLNGHGNVGYGLGHNLALGKVHSDFHLILNPDVEMEPVALLNAIAFLREYSDVGLASPRVDNGAGVQQYLCKRYPTVLDVALRGFAPAWLRRRFSVRLARYEMRDVIDPDQVYLDPPTVSGCWMMFRTTVLQRLGGFDPQFFLYFEDFDLSLRTSDMARIAYVPTVRIKHFGGNASRKGLRHIRFFVQSAAIFWNKHGWHWM